MAEDAAEVVARGRALKKKRNERMVSEGRGTSGRTQAHMHLEDSANAIDGHPNEILALGVCETRWVTSSSVKSQQRGDIQFSSIISTSVRNPRQLTNI